MGKGRGYKRGRIRATTPVVTEFSQTKTGPSLKIRIINFFKKHIVLLGAALFTITAPVASYYIIESINSVETDLTIKSVNYLRDTSQFRVYSINFTINNSGDQDVTLIQAIPKEYTKFAVSDPLNFLLNNKCESYKDAIIEKGKIKDYQVQIYIHKLSIEAIKQIHKNTDTNKLVFDDKYGVFIKPSNISLSISAYVDVRIYGADQKYRKANSRPVSLLFRQGVESDADWSLEPVQFVATKGKLYKCPIKANDK